MTLPPPGKLLVVAVVLLGAALAQTAHPSSHPSASGAAPMVPVPHGPLVVPRPADSPTRAVPIRNHPATTVPPVRKKSRRTAQPATWNQRAGGKVLYLTFDDGPQRVYTPKVLSVLAKHHAKATFFVIGREAAAHPELVEQARRAGHRIGNHTWDHPKLTTLPDARLRQEIASGVRSRCFRPPFRDTDAHVAAVAAQYGQRQILWDVDTMDWAKPGAATIERAILRGARPGAIILLHDGGGNRAQTLTALDRALPKLTTQGYTFHPLPC